jgi:hypothetical protein
MHAETEQLLHDAAARPARDLDLARLNGRRLRRRSRRRVLGAVSAVAVLVVAVISVAATDDGGHSLDFAPAGPADDALIAGQEVTLPEPGEITMAWLEARNGLPVPIFVVRDPAGDAHAVRATTPYFADVDASVGWCGEGSVLLSWQLGAIFAPDGSYAGGPPARGLDTFDTELTERGTVRIGAQRRGLSREASRAQADEQQRRWGRRDHNLCYAAGSPLNALVLHGIPGVAATERAEVTAPSAVALDGPERPEGWVLLDGTLVVGEATGQPPLLCDDLVSVDPPACPEDAPRVRMAHLRQDAGTWAYTGLFRAAVVGGQFHRLTFVIADVSHIGGEEPPTLDPPLQYPDGTVEDGVVTVAAGDLHYGPPPPPLPAGSYELRLDNSGGLPHTLVNDELNISLRADRGHRDSSQVHLPRGRHTFVCEIPGHAAAGMQITLTVN